MQPLNFLLMIFCLWGLPTGCASYGVDQKTFDGEGFRVSIPNLQTRAVVWGNHAEAVKHASDWLNDEQILVLYRLADNDMGSTAMASQAKAKPQIHMLSAARRVGAPLVIFLHVNEKLVETPELVNEHPYTDGWLYKVTLADKGELTSLLTADQYTQKVTEQD